MKFANANQWGATFSLRRGHFICIHPSPGDDGDEIGLRFRAWVEGAPRVRFRPREGDIYVVNNHRCLHGRLAFQDPRRTYLRMILWFVEPCEAPPELAAHAAAAGRALAERLAGEPHWLRRRF